jgi:hypothetical protein
MPLGDGYFYDRKKRKYIRIQEHATAVIENPKLYKSEEVASLNPVKDRDEIVLYALKQGFIRVRDYRGRLGWQFYGDVEGALNELKKYMKKNEFGVGYVITFTDFRTGKEVVANTPHFLNAKAKDVWE